MGKDHTLYALKEGQVRFERHKLSGRKWVHVDPKEGHVLHPVYATAAADADAVDGSQLCWWGEFCEDQTILAQEK